jgi:hypothetical protein
VVSIASISDRVWFDFPTERLFIIVPYEIKVEGSVSGSGQASVDWNVNGDTGTHYIGQPADNLRGEFVAPAGAASYNIKINLTGGASAGSGEGANTGRYDIAHTVRFRMILPEGVVGHSASGLFPFYSENDPVGHDTPEPGVMLLLGSGLLSLVVYGRSRA